MTVAFSSLFKAMNFPTFHATTITKQARDRQGSSSYHFIHSLDCFWAANSAASTHHLLLLIGSIESNQALANFNWYLSSTKEPLKRHRLGFCGRSKPDRFKMVRIVKSSTSFGVHVVVFKMALMFAVVPVRYRRRLSYPRENAKWSPVACLVILSIWSPVSVTHHLRAVRPVRPNQSPE
jgi:hypothetical protein